MHALGSFQALFLLVAQSKFGSDDFPHLHDLSLYKVGDHTRDEFDDFGVPKSTECGARPAQHEITCKDGNLAAKGCWC